MQALPIPITCGIVALCNLLKDKGFRVRPDTVLARDAGVGLDDAGFSLLRAIEQGYLEDNGDYRAILLTDKGEEAAATLGDEYEHLLRVLLDVELDESVKHYWREHVPRIVERAKHEY